MSAEPASRPDGDRLELPLFPLQSVLFPGGLLGLKVFEARYLDLISRCLRTGSGFGVVALRAGTEVRQPDEPVALENVGTVADILEVDSPQSGILTVRCRGGGRFATHAVRQLPDGLWVAEVSRLDDDEPVHPGELQRAAQALSNAIEALKAQGAEPFLPPWRLDDAGWVANRWCEILPISVAAKQKLMALDDPLVRLRLVDDYLRNKGVVG